MTTRNPNGKISESEKILVYKKYILNFIYQKINNFYFVIIFLIWIFIVKYFNEWMKKLNQFNNE